MRVCVGCGHENPVEQRFCGECGARLVVAAVAQERKTVSALFCDLVGSTALGERLDPEVMAGLLEEYQQICRRVVESHGGVVQKFIGDAVVAVFGVPAAHEDDPERAVRTGLRLVEEVAASELAVEVRVGIDTGEVLVRQDVDPGAGLGFVTGDAMNTAARLQTAAPPMGVVVGESTRTAAGSAVVFEALPPIVAKGKAEPVPAWLALRPVARVGTPERDRSPFVGRELELGMLTQLFERSRARSSVEFVTLVGEAGLGKSRLVRELARYVEDLSDLVVWREGRCLPFGEGVTFWALGEVVRAQAGIFDTDDQAALAMKLDAAVTEPDPQLKSWMVDRLAPLVGLTTSTQPPQQEEVFAAWRRFLEQLAGTGPAVVVIEDLHWADPGFVAFLTDLSERLAEVALLVVVTARPEVEERHPSWPPGRRSTVLSLSPLTDDEIQALVADALGGAPEDVVGAVLQRAGGSPLFAEQLAKLAVEQRLPGVGPEVHGLGLDGGQVPATVQALIAARIDGLPADAKAVLLQASVVGKTFWEQTVTTFGAQLDVVGALAELARRELVRSVVSSTMTGQAEYAFWHALVRDVAYGQMTHAERGRLHAATARWIADTVGEVLGESAEVIVHHLDTATVYGITLDADSDRLLSTALEHAARTAMRTDIRQAETHLQRLIAFPDLPPARRWEAMLSLAQALTSQGRNAEVVALLEPAVGELLDAGELELAVSLVLRLDRSQYIIGQRARGEVVIRRVREALPDSPTAGAARLLAYEAERLTDPARFAEIPVRVQEAIDTAAEAGVPPPPGAGLALAYYRLQNGDPSAPDDVLAASAPHLWEGDVRPELTAMINIVLLGEGRPDQKLAVLDEVQDRATQMGMDGTVTFAGVARLNVLVVLGRLDEVMASVPDVLAWAKEHDDLQIRSFCLDAEAYVAYLRADTSYDPGELIAANESLGFSGPPLLGLLALQRGDTDEALRWLDNAGGSGVDAGVRTAVGADRLDLARRILAEETPLEAGTQPPLVHRIALALLAEAEGDLDSACGLFTDVVAEFAAVGNVADRAECLTDLGRCLIRSGQHEQGRQRLIQARQLWVGMKATPRVEAIDFLLQRASP